MKPPSVGLKLNMRLQLFFLILSTLASCAAGKPLSKAAERNKLLLISFDGFRWDYDQDVDTPHLDQLAVDGVKAKYVTPPMLTMTAPSHFTTITGNDGGRFTQTLRKQLLQTQEENLHLKIFNQL